MLSRLFALIVLLILASLSAITNSSTYRNAVPASISQVASQLEDSDWSTSNWKLRERQSFDPSVIEVLRTEGYFKHVYTNVKSRQMVAVAMFIGPTGPMVAHTPEVCYPANAYETTSSPTRVLVASNENQNGDLGDHEFWTATFRSGDVHRNFLRVYYGWARLPESTEAVHPPHQSDSSLRWQAPTSPRLSFADQAFLYRIQVATPISAGQEHDEEDAAMAFLRQLLRSDNQPASS